MKGYVCWHLRKSKKINTIKKRLPSLVTIVRTDLPLSFQKSPPFDYVIVDIVPSSFVKINDKMRPDISKK